MSLFLLQKLTCTFTFRWTGETVVSAAIEWVNSQLREDNDTLKSQLEAYKNEVYLLKMEAGDHGGGGGDTDKQLAVLKQAMQGMQQVGLMISFFFPPPIWYRHIEFSFSTSICVSSRQVPSKDSETARPK